MIHLLKNCCNGPKAKLEKTFKEKAAEITKNDLAAIPRSKSRKHGSTEQDVKDAIETGRSVTHTEFSPKVSNHVVRWSGINGDNRSLQMANALTSWFRRA